MSDHNWLILLPLVALLLWLTLFLFTLVDHFIYRGTYGHFLRMLEGLERRLGQDREAIAAYLQRVQTPYLSRFVANASSPRFAARLAAEPVLTRIGEAKLLQHAGDFRPRRRAQQVRALYVLARTGHPATLPLLERALHSKDTVLAYAALDMLDICDSVAAAEVLLRGIETDALPASRIATQLEHFGTDLRELYYAKLAQNTPKTRYWVAYLLGKCAYSTESEQRLVALLEDDQASVRKIALSSLAELGAPQLRQRAIAMLGDPVFFVRTQACRVLARFTDREVIRALASRLGDAHDAVQLAAKKSLVEIGTPALAVLDAPDEFAQTAVPAQFAEVTRSIRAVTQASARSLIHA